MMVLYTTEVQSVLSSRPHRLTYERLNSSVRSGVNLEVSLLVETLVAVGHTTLIPFLWFLSRWKTRGRLGFLFLGRM